MGIFAFRRVKLLMGESENYFGPDARGIKIVVEVFLFEAISPQPVNHVEAQEYICKI
jgi:hypothetical protein